MPGAGPLELLRSLRGAGLVSRPPKENPRVGPGVFLASGCASLVGCACANQLRGTQRITPTSPRAILFHGFAFRRRKIVPGASREPHPEARIWVGTQMRKSGQRASSRSCERDTSRSIRGVAETRQMRSKEAVRRAQLRTKVPTVEHERESYGAGVPTPRRESRCIYPSWEFTYKRKNHATAGRFRT